MSPIVVTQRTRGDDPLLIKLTAEIRGAGFSNGSFRFSRDWPSTGGRFHLRPRDMPIDLHATVVKLRKRGFRYHEWCATLADRYATLLERVWNER